MCVELYEHNIEPYNRIIDSIKAGNKKIAVSHATGTGKTYLISKLFEDYSDEKKLVLVPLNYIRKNMSKTFGEYSIKNADIMLYQSLINKTPKELASMEYQKIVLDEFHHATSDVWGDRVNTLINTHPDSVVFGTSATPVRTDGIDVIEELFNGNCVSELPMAEAMVEKILPIPKYVAGTLFVDARLKEFQDKAEKSGWSSEEKKEFARTIAHMRSHVEESYGMPTILSEHIKDKNGKYLVFCKNKTHLKKMRKVVVEWFKTAGFNNINDYATYSDYGDKDTDFENFQKDTSNNLKLLFCINMLNEGLHLKDVSGAILLRTTGSHIIFRQQIGRVLAASSKRTPVIIDAVSNSTFVGDGIDLLKEIKDAIQDKKKIETDFNDSVFKEIDTFFITGHVKNIINLLNELEFSITTNWDLNIRGLEIYKQREGNCLVHRDHIENVNGVCVKLGNWCRNVRQVKAGNTRGLLTKKRKEQLDELGFIWNVYDFNWEYMFDKLQKHKNKYNSFCKLDSELANWCVRQRQCKKNGTLCPQKIEKLDNIGFWWDSTWEQFLNNCSLYDQYMQTHHRALPIRNNEKLSKWCVSQRERDKNGSLDKKERDMLTKIGFVFDVKKAYFDAGINYYSCYKKRMGTIPKRFVTEDGFPLDNWISSQKNKYREGKLSKSEMDELLKIGFVFSTNNTLFDHEFDIFCKYLQDGNSAVDIPQNLIYKNVKLGQSVSAWRQGYKKGSLSEYRRKKLESINFCWDAKDFHWKEKLNFIIDYKKNNRHGILKSDIALKPYYDWLVENKRKLKQGLLSEEREALLMHSGLLE